MARGVEAARLEEARDGVPWRQWGPYLNYRYPLAEYPYADLIATNRERSRTAMEYELFDTGIFDDDRYVDVDVEYAKRSTDDILVRITVTNHGANEATVHLLPTLWLRNTWWMDQPKGTLAADGADTIVVEHPDLGRRMTAIFTTGADGRRPVYGGTEKFQTDPAWRDLVLFYEYFHGDNGAGLGASHQTGWTGLVARIIQMSSYLDPEQIREHALGGMLVYERPDQ